MRKDHVKILSTLSIIMYKMYMY